MSCIQTLLKQAATPTYPKDLGEVGLSPLHAATFIGGGAAIGSLLNYLAAPKPDKYSLGTGAVIGAGLGAGGLYLYNKSKL